MTDTPPDRPLQPVPIRDRRRRLGPRRTALAAALALALLAEAEPSQAQPTGAQLERAWTDSRLHALRLSDRQGSESLAAQHGLQDYLLDRPSRGNLPVTNCANSGAGSLRDVIASAANGDVVDLRGLTCSTITLGGGEIVVPQNSLSIIGRGPDTLTINSKYGTSRIFNHGGTGLFLIQGITIERGGVIGSEASPSAVGGCIRSSGTVGLGNALFVGLPQLGAHVEDCHAEAFPHPAGYGLAGGGGIFAGNVIMVNSTISDSSATAYSDGGGLRIDGGGGIATNNLSMLFSNLTDNIESGSKYGGGGAALFCGSGDPGIIMNSTISGNSARGGGGLTLARAVTLRNVTISGNTADDRGGGIAIGGLCGDDIVIANGTIADNRILGDATGGGLSTSPLGTVTLHSTIVHGNFRFSTVPDDIGGEPSVAGANNLVGFSQVALPPGTILGIDPLLGPLAGNGGRTQTHALSPSSQAIGLGSNVYGLTTDQRGDGFPRVVGTLPDIGAFEFDPDRLFANGFE